MESDHQAREAGRLFLGEATVPLRNNAEQDAERERAERLCLIGKARRTWRGRHVLLFAALAAALLLSMHPLFSQGIAA